jgi:hypothetical protein
MNHKEDKADGAAEHSVKSHTCTATTYIKSFQTFSRPVVLLCDDGRSYVIKGLQPSQRMGHGLTTEQVIGRLGQTLGAPVPPIALVMVPQDLIDLEPQMAHLSPGIAHGSLLMPNVSERAGIYPPITNQDRAWYASLAVMYGWGHAGDHQLVYSLDAERRPYSVDHGHFLPGGPNWSAATLSPSIPAIPDQNFAQHVTLDDLENPLQIARSLSEADLSGLLEFSLPHWGVPPHDLTALESFLRTRQGEL